VAEILGHQDMSEHQTAKIDGKADDDSDDEENFTQHVDVKVVDNGNSPSASKVEPTGQTPDGVAAKVNGSGKTKSASSQSF
jgi:hypothetical protein